jgi:endonuclease/exonuclease/phosphatase family metal-dependent hydrolase
LTASEEPKSPSAVLRVASYNIHQAVGGDSRRDLARVAGVINQLNADVVALQEVHDRFAGDAQSRQLEYLAAATGMEALAGATMLHSDGQYGNAVLVRAPIERRRLHDLSFASREPRGVIDLLLTTSLGRLHLLATHLGLRAGERRSQVQLLLKLIAERPDPVILAGDFNEWFPWGRSLRWLKRVLPGGHPIRTFPAFCPIFPLDRILVGPQLHIRRLEAVRDGNARVASDHLPLLAEIVKTG